MNEHAQTRGRLALSRVHADVARKSSTNQRGMSMIIAFWVVWSGMLFLRMYREPDAASAENVVIAVLTLAMGWFILRACRKDLRSR